MEASTSRTPVARQQTFKRPLSKTDQVLEKIAKKITTDEPKEKYASFADHVAEKLRCMRSEMVAISQKLISEVIFYGETNQLNMSSRIVTDIGVTPPITFNYEVSRSPSAASTSDEPSLQSRSNTIIEAYMDALN